MNEMLFLTQLSSLKNGESTKTYRAVVTEKVSERNQNEVFDVEVFRNRDGLFKLQWARKGKPELPRLKPEINQKLKEAFRNRTTHLTSGPGASKDGMATPEMVVEMIRVLGRNGILIEIS